MKGDGSGGRNRFLSEVEGGSEEISVKSWELRVESCTGREVACNVWRDFFYYNEFIAEMRAA